MPDPKRYEEFAGLVRLHTSQVLAYINALLLNWSDADDLFQETCLVLWQKFDQFEPGTNFLAWALRIADNKVMKFKTKRARSAVFTADLRHAIMADVAQRSADDATASLTALSGCMDRLADSDRKMMTLCYGESIPVRQFADAIGRSPQSVHHSLCRVRKWLLDCVGRELRRANTAAPSSRNVLKPEDQP